MLCALGQAAASWARTTGFAVAAVGAALAFAAVWRIDGPRRASAFAVVAAAFGVAAAIPAIPTPLFVVALIPFVPVVLRASRQALAGGVTVGAVSAAACLFWWLSRDGFTFYTFVPNEIAARIGWGGVLAACALGAAFNAAWEELLWRRVLLDAISGPGGLSPVIAAIALSVLFGLAHFNSLPGGSFGVIMTGGFAGAAYVLRWFFRGTLLPSLIAHFLADLLLLALVSFAA